MTGASFTIENGIALPLAVIDVIRANRDHLSDLDGAAGDGDHGINMAKGMSLARARLEQQQAPDLTAGFMTISDVLVSEIGGSMGPLYGGFFRGIGVSSRSRGNIDATAYGQMLSEGVKRIRRVTDAQVGDKTLIDVLEPALNAYARTLESENNFSAALTSMTVAACGGLESTRNMMAKIGRSSRLGERSIGHLDAGAASCTLILEAMNTTAERLLTEESN